MIIRIDYQEPDVMLDLWGGTSGVYNGFDRFGRIIDQRWINYIGGTVDIDRYKYGYDRNSNRTWKENTVSKALGTPVYLDEFYTYDNLNRLTMMQRGQLTGSPPSGISGTPSKEQDWTLDKTGNWSNFTTKSAGTTDLNQTRTSNTVNELTGFTTSTGTAWATPAYDAAGNTITMPQPNNLGSSYTAVYDAWNRMVSISDSSNTVAQYQYDGRGRRAVKLTYTGGTLSETRHVYWSNDWQDLEERVGSATTADTQYVWGVRYVDELVCRDASSTRLYALQDGNFNLNSITDASGAVQERYVFYPYGQRLIFDGSWGSRSSSSYGWEIGHQGLMHDVETVLVYNRNRCLHQRLGEFLQRDIVPYNEALNVYQYLESRVTGGLDPLGTTFCWYDAEIGQLICTTDSPTDVPLVPPPLGPPHSRSKSCDCNSPGPKPAAFKVECRKVHTLGRSHCWIAVLDTNGAAIGTISGNPEYPGSFPPCCWGIVVYTPDYDLGAKFYWSRPLPVPNGMNACQFAECLDNAALEYEGEGHTYNPPAGATSNTLVARVARKCGSRAPLPYVAKGHR